MGTKLYHVTLNVRNNYHYGAAGVGRVTVLSSLPGPPSLPPPLVERMCPFRTEAWLQTSYVGNPEFPRMTDTNSSGQRPIVPQALHVCVK